jgi:hypothetical protein
MLEFILWFILIYILLRAFAKFAFPLLLKYYLKKFQQKFYQQNSHIEPNRKDGDTNIEFTSEKKKRKSNNTENIGEYIDYEEVEPK